MGVVPPEGSLCWTEAILTQSVSVNVVMLSSPKTRDNIQTSQQVQQYVCAIAHFELMFVLKKVCLWCASSLSVFLYIFVL